MHTQYSDITSRPRCCTGTFSHESFYSNNTEINHSNRFKRRPELLSILVFATFYIRERVFEGDNPLGHVHNSNHEHEQLTQPPSTSHTHTQTDSSQLLRKHQTQTPNSPSAVNGLELSILVNARVFDEWDKPWWSDSRLDSPEALSGFQRMPRNRWRSAHSTESHVLSFRECGTTPPNPFIYCLIYLILADLHDPKSRYYSGIVMRNKLYLCPKRLRLLRAGTPSTWYIDDKSPHRHIHFLVTSGKFLFLFFFYTEMFLTRKCFVYDLYTSLEARLKEQGSSSQQDAIWASGTYRLRQKVLWMTPSFFFFFFKLRH